VRGPQHPNAGSDFGFAGFDHGGTRAMRIYWIHILLLVVYATSTATGNLALEVAAPRINATNGLTAALVSTVTNPALWLGIALYGFSFLFWLWLLSFIPLRYAYPVSSMSIVIAPLISGIIYKDLPHGTYWIGLGFVITGLTLIVTR
jgi:multidrug transporter EmrE-like cation transporter